MSDCDWDEPQSPSGHTELNKSLNNNQNRRNYDNTNSGYQRNDDGERRYNDYGRRSSGGFGRKNDDSGRRSGDFGQRYSDNSKRGFDINETIQIDAKDIGRIIGSGGSNIQKYQTDFGVHIQLDKTNLTVTVSGRDRANVIDCTQAIEKLNASNSGGRDGGQRRQYNNDRRDYQNDRRDYNNDRRDYHNDRRDYHNDRRDYGRRDRYQKSDKNDFYNSQPDTEPKEQFELPLIEEGVIDWAALNKRSEDAQKERLAKLPPLTKNFYNEVPEVANLSEDEIERIRSENNNITVSRIFEDPDGSKQTAIPNPIWNFKQCFGDYPDIMSEIEKQGFTKPSPIQCQAWPILLQGEDMIGIAQTGTGKTLAFLLPAMIHTDLQSTPRSERGGPNVLILAPTRELALQIEKEVNKYSFRGMKAVCVYGGGDRRDQISSVEQGVEIIICTPGRLNDLIQAKVINVTSVTFLILDEADRMLDMGFEPQIRKVLLDIRPDRQTVMTSATWPAGVRRLAQSYMKNPIQVCVGSLDLAATHTVEQIIEILEEEDKFHRVHKFAKEMKQDEKIIIFCGRKVRADDLSSDLTLEGFHCTSIHGSRDQSDREQAIADISSGEIRILIATDVASRGLDIEDITHVINYDFPQNIEEYVHRVGRTGRAGRTGKSISFLTRTDWGLAKELIDILKEANQEIPTELHDMAERFQAMKDRRANEFRQYKGDGGGGGRRFGGGGGRRRY